MSETRQESRFPGEPYILVRVMDVGTDGYEIEFEHSGFRDRETAMEFLRDLTSTAREA